VLARNLTSRRSSTLVVERGTVRETYNIGARNERANIDVVREICALLDEIEPAAGGQRERLITFVSDRPGHDRRYAIDPSKIERELGWAATETFETGLRKTVHWYVNNRRWWQSILDRGYRSGRIKRIPPPKAAFLDRFILPSLM
jgi:dTDP-glucose 4,6-dehydratase